MGTGKPRQVASILASGLVLLASLTQPTAAAEKSPYPKANLHTVAGAKVQLCKGFAEETLDYYMMRQMPKEFATYTQANEFEADQKQSLRDLALARMREEAATRFSPGKTYLIERRGAQISEYKRAPDGFEVEFPSVTTMHTTYWLRPDGKRELIDLQQTLGLRNVVDKRILQDQDSKITRPATGLPQLALYYAWLPSDMEALRANSDRPDAIFIPMAEDRARKIAEEYRGVRDRRGVVDLLVRIERCDRQPPDNNFVYARVVGFTLHTAKLGKGFFETEASWKPRTLIAEWRSPSWEAEAGASGAVPGRAKSKQE